MNRFLLLGLSIASVAHASFAHAAACTGHGVELQVLGSGGPELISHRASSSYLIWRDGRASVLIDSGGGSALRFGEAGAHIADLDLVLFTHLHADHTADFPALVKSSYFQQRKHALAVLGPAGNDRFPATTDFIVDLFDVKRGIYRYLSDYLPNDGKPKPDSYALEPRDIQPHLREIKPVFSAKGLKAIAAHVLHGSAPALAWRIEADGVSIVFSGDTDGNNKNLEKLAKGADLFVAHNAIPESATGVARALHMPPSVIGRIAAEAKVKALVLSHRMERSLGHEEETTRLIRTSYSGPVVFADDLDCYAAAGE
jgi:ribonuclease BN (tRNA processing enzyme)